MYILIYFRSAVGAEKGLFEKIVYKLFWDKDDDSHTLLCSSQTIAKPPYQTLKFSISKDHGPKRKEV